MNGLKHIIGAPFVAATGLAALLHSTWSLGTLMAGTQPEAALSVAFVGWLAPALLIAFALDVGQIVTSADIRRHGLTRARALTFGVFAIATYYLQWLYMAHHMPSLQLAPGIRESWGAMAALMRDAAVWIIPALMPLSTLLYTFSDGNKAQAHEQPAQPVALEPAQPVETPAKIDIERVEVVTIDPPTLRPELEPLYLPDVDESRIWNSAPKVGRPRKWSSVAEKQRAYRARSKGER